VSCVGVSAHLITFEHSGTWCGRHTYEGHPTLEFLIGKNHDSSVGVATRLRAGRSRFKGSIPGGGCEFFFSRTALEPTQPSIQWVPVSLCLWVKRLGHEADNSLPTSAEVKDLLAM
jgi:hypothetical protein